MKSLTKVLRESPKMNNSPIIVLKSVRYNTLLCTIQQEYPLLQHQLYSIQFW